MVCIVRHTDFAIEVDKALRGHCAVLTFKSRYGRKHEIMAIIGGRSGKPCLNPVVVIKSHVALIGGTRGVALCGRGVTLFITRLHELCVFNLENRAP